MIGLSIILDGDNCWPELKNEDGSPAFLEGELVGVARLPNGTVQGDSTVAFRVELPNGETVLAETTLTLLENAVKAFLIADQSTGKDRVQ